MSLGIAIVLGVVGISALGIVSEIVTTAIKSKAKSRSGPPPAELEELRARLRALEGRLDERDGAVQRLEEELRFVSRMLEDKSGGPRP